jgi:hypothetical protein
MAVRAGGKYSYHCALRHSPKHMGTVRTAITRPVAPRQCGTPRWGGRYAYFQATCQVWWLVGCFLPRSYTFLSGENIWRGLAIGLT